nr:hypothetical protein [Tanacetum cinerariifolium]
MMMKRIDELEHIMANLIQVNKDIEERDLPEADMKEILHQRMWETKSYKSHEDHMQLFEALEKSMNRDHSEELAQHLAEVRKKKKKSRESPKTPPGLRPSISLIPADLEMDADMAPDEQAQSSDDEDIECAHIPKASALASNYSPSPEDSLLAQIGDITTFMDWFCKRRGITELKPQDLEDLAFEIVKVFHPDVIHLQYQMEECHKLLTDSVDDPILRHNVSKPLPLGAPPGQVTIQSDFFNKDLEYLKYGSKGRRPALLEQMVPDQFWIEEECKYDIAAMYGISHWWFQIQRFYIDRHTSEGDRRAGCHVLGKYGVQMMMRFNKIHKFSDGTLHQIDEALDYRVKEFGINRMNPGLNTRFWTKKDVDRCKAFMFAIQRRLRTRRIFRNLESFVGGCVREGDYILLKRTE